MSTHATAGRRIGGASSRTRSERRLGWMLCAPAVFAMLLVTAYPIVYALVLSVQNLDLRFPNEGGFVGLDNYKTVLTSSLWWTDLFNTAFITVITVTIELILGMAIALVMYRAIFGRGAIRAAVLIPYGIVTVVAAFSWQFAFDPSTGFVNHLPLIADDKAWFGGRFSSFAVIILAEIWKTTPFMALLLLAGLTTIDNGLYEAAKVDGANAWQRFWSITLPLLAPVIVIILILRTSFAFAVFEEILAITQGGPGDASYVAAWYTYKLTFSPPNNIGMGAASAYVLALVVGLFAVAYVKLIYKRIA
jgi:multiple sugar transport system permease protein